MFKRSTHIMYSLLVLSVLFITHSAYNTLRLYAVKATDRTIHNAEESSALQANPTQSCNLSGLISTNTTWSPSTCNPYIATGSVIVDTAYTLTVEAGTNIKWNPGTALTIRGTLLARGSAEQPVTFTSNQTTPKAGDWVGIEFVDSSRDAEYDANENYLRGSMIQHTVIEYAGKNGNTSVAAVNTKGASPYIDHTTIQNNQGEGVNINGKTIHFTNNQVLSNLGTGIYINHCQGDGSGLIDTIIHKNIVSNNKDSGIIIYTTGDCNPIISENVITNNSNNRINALAGGIHCEGPSIGRPIVTLVKNIISNNSTSSCGGGIALRWTEYHVLEGNLIESNQSETGGGVCFGLWANQGLMLDNDVKNNVSKFGGGVISSGNTEFHYNRFENNLVNGALNHFYNNSSQSTPNIDAEDNWWGSSDPATIESSIYHFADDSAQGVVDFEPFCNESCKPPEPLKVFLPMVAR